MRAPAPYRAEQGYLDAEESKDQTLEPDRAVANDNGSSTPPAPAGPQPYQPPTGGDDPRSATEGVMAARPVTQAPTFSQMQAAGEARPPMPESAPDPSAGPTAPISTLSGDWQAPTASTQSAPLIASAAGGTMTPQGDASNPFKGYETDQGGKFGGYDSVPLVNDAAGRTFKTYDQDFVTNANALKQVPPLTPQEFQAMSASDSGANAIKDKIANGLPVTDKELAFVRQARGMELQQDVAAPTFGTFGTKEGTTTAADPALQQELLAGQAAGTVPSGPQAYTPPSAPAASPATPPVNGGVVPASNGGIITTQTGGQNTGPSAPATQGQSSGGQSGTPSSFDILGTLMKGAGGQGAGSEVQNATQQSILNQLKNPNAYGSKEVQDAYGWLGGNIDDEYALRERQLKEDMSRRGLSDSTINAGNLKDLNIGRRSAKESMAYDLAQQMAKSQQSATGQAIDQGLQGGSTAQNAQMDWLRNLIGYGQQGFENDMRVGEFNADQENNWQDFLMKMLGAGYAGG